MWKTFECGWFFPIFQRPDFFWITKYQFKIYIVDSTGDILCVICTWAIGNLVKVTVQWWPWWLVQVVTPKRGVTTTDPWKDLRETSQSRKVSILGTTKILWKTFKLAMSHCPGVFFVFSSWTEGLVLTSPQPPSLYSWIFDETLCALYIELPYLGVSSLQLLF